MLRKFPRRALSRPLDLKDHSPYSGRGLGEGKGLHSPSPNPLPQLTYTHVKTPGAGEGFSNAITHCQSRLMTGFTLLEILIAMFIFTIVSMIIVSALRTAINTQVSTERNAKRFAELQFAFIILARDFEQVINRPITTATGMEEQAFLGTPNSATFTHAGFANPLGQHLQSTLQRTEYLLEKEMLIRQTWAALDQTQQTGINKRPIIKRITNLEFAYLDKDNHFQTRWPPPNQSSGGMPRAVRISLTLSDLGKISQLYIIPGPKSETPK